MSRFTNIHDSGLFLSHGADDIYDIARRGGGLCIDGGAAAGFVTKRLLKDSECRVWAFEPFPGNLQYFRKTVGDDPRVTLYEAALGNFCGPGAFYVNRVVKVNQPGWGTRPGYSSEGRLVPAEFKASKGQLYSVEVLRLGDLINEEVTLLKLDLQGGEYDALVGMGERIARVHCAYVEFSLDWRLMEYLTSKHFVVFDTPYTGIPKVAVQEVISLLDEAKVIDLSNGYQAVSGVIRGLPRDFRGYRAFLEEFKKQYFHHLWSDLIAVNEAHLRDFLSTALK